MKPPFNRDTLWTNTGAGMLTRILKWQQQQQQKTHKNPFQFHNRVSTRASHHTTPVLGPISTLLMPQLVSSGLHHRLAVKRRSFFKHRILKGNATYLGERAAATAEEKRHTRREEPRGSGACFVTDKATKFLSVHQHFSPPPVAYEPSCRCFGVASRGAPLSRRAGGPKRTAIAPRKTSKVSDFIDRERERQRWGRRGWDKSKRDRRVGEPQPIFLHSILPSSIPPSVDASPNRTRDKKRRRRHRARTMKKKSQRRFLPVADDHTFDSLHLCGSWRLSRRVAVWCFFNRCAAWMRAAGRASPLGDGAAVKGVDGGAERLRKVPIPFKGPVQEEGSRLPRQSLNV